MNRFTLLILVVCTLCLISCTQTPDEPQFFADKNPKLLSHWNVLSIKSNTLKPHSSSKTYSLNSSLFSDYAHKLRTIWTPDYTIKYSDDGTINFPVGTVISKTFYYPKNKADSIDLTEQINQELDSINLTTHQLIETRLLVKRKSGWVGLPYIWNKEQTEAKLQRFGDVIELSGIDKNNKLHSFNYLVPDVNQCAACHQWDMNTGMQPIGLQTRHLNKNDNIPKAKQYLDINCSHCHNPTGPANTSGLHLEAFREISTEYGLCKLPIAAGKGTGGRSFDIDPGHPENSIFTYRMESTDPASMMPELGRSLVHQEGLELIANWIAAMEGQCHAE